MLGRFYNKYKVSYKLIYLTKINFKSIVSLRKKNIIKIEVMRLKELNIAKVLVKKRKNKGVTQDELALYIGVSKASVSKWETGQSYPDITFLPQLATYFNISIDELMGYSPQMTKKDIKATYHKLSADFSNKAFHQVLSECQEIIKKYYSCFPLLLQMVILYINHYMLTENREEQEKILQDAIDLCIHIKEESDDVWLLKQANSLEATAYMLLGKPQQIFELLDGILYPKPQDESILANAYYMIGDIEKAKEVMQISLYGHLLGSISGLTSLLTMYQNEKEQFEKIINRGKNIIEIFKLRRLHPNSVLQFCLAAAQGYLTLGDLENALAMLQSYVDICTDEQLLFKLCGDDFFNKIDAWFNEFDLGVEAPRDDKIIKESMIHGIESNPAFTLMKDNIQYKNLVRIMKSKLGGH